MTAAITKKNTLDDVNLDKYSEQTDIAIFSLLSANDTTSEGFFAAGQEKRLPAEQTALFNY